MDGGGRCWCGRRSCGGDPERVCGCEEEERVVGEGRGARELGYSKRLRQSARGRERTVGEEVMRLGNDQTAGIDCTVVRWERRRAEASSGRARGQRTRSKMTY
jgi:hypothetical protein